ncbi:MAG: hypothetical protein HY777_16695 [Betaproteobacteria bacterium]|nr:hypothetical protein [Betaproteobacteria bacterium]
MTFKKGQSGNPKGKPPGITARGKFRQQVDAALPGIVANVIQLAQDGDMQATKLILDRCIPALKPTSDNVSLPMATDATLVDKGLQVVTAAATGRLNTDDAKAIMDLLVAQSRLIEQGEVLQRLEAVEQWLATKK